MCALSLVLKRTDQARSECARAAAVAPALPELALLDERLGSGHRQLGDLLQLARLNRGLEPLVGAVLDAARRDLRPARERLELLDELMQGRPLGAKLLVEKTMLLAELLRLDDAVATARAAEALAPWD